MIINNYNLVSNILVWFDFEILILGCQADGLRLNGKWFSSGG